MHNAAARCRIYDGATLVSNAAVGSADRFAVGDGALIGAGAKIVNWIGRSLTGWGRARTGLSLVLTRLMTRHGFARAAGHFRPPPRTDTIDKQRAGRPQASPALRRRRLLATVVALTAVVCGALGAGYATVVRVQPTALAYDFVAFDATAAKSSDPFAGSEFVLQRMQGYAQIAGSASVLRAVRSNLGLSQSVAELQGHMLVTTPPNTVFLKIQVTDSDGATAVLLADAVAKQAATVIESLEARGSGTAHSPVHVVAISSMRAMRSGKAVHYVKLILLGAVLGLVLGLLLSGLLTGIANFSRHGSALSVKAVYLNGKRPGLAAGDLDTHIAQGSEPGPEGGRRP